MNELFKLNASELALSTADVARAITAAFAPAKINHGAYSNRLPHLYFHLVPKYTDGAAWGTTVTMMPELKQFLSEADCAASIARLRQALG